jgi:hypothetical protein
MRPETAWYLGHREKTALFEDPSPWGGVDPIGAGLAGGGFGTAAGGLALMGKAKHPALRGLGIAAALGGLGAGTYGSMRAHKHQRDYWRSQGLPEWLAGHGW